MAKKNSSKTATEKAIQSSEPRVMTYKGWQGVNFVDAPLTWQPLEIGQNKFRQTDLPDNYLMVQNNLNTTDTLSLETRMDSEVVGRLTRDTEFTSYEYDDQTEEWVANTETITWPANPVLGYRLTGVSAIYKHWVFAVVRYHFLKPGTIRPTQTWYEKVIYRDLNSANIDDWFVIDIVPDDEKLAVEELGFFEGNLVATAHLEDNGMLLLAKVDVSTEDDEEIILINGMNWEDRKETNRNKLVDTPKITPGGYDRPQVSPVITAQGDMAQHDLTPTDQAPVLVEVKFCYVNRLGSTLTHSDQSNPSDSAVRASTFLELSPALWTAKKFVKITPAAAETPSDEQSDTWFKSVTGIDFYGRDTENLDWVFIGHIDVEPEQILNPDKLWEYNWYGNMTDITQWITAQLMVPTDNTTHGPDATHFSCHDSRMYYWGMPSKPYRLWIGGNPGAEFSVARGLGGAWIDIEPGSGYDVKGTAKWKTVSGANIITIMCGNENTTKIKRFNLVETNLTLTNEVAYKSYMYEEVSNVVGCNSRWGYGVFTEGLYSLNRYGLMLTTMAMEYNSQMKNQSVSDVIEPIFTGINGKYLRDGRMVCINEIIYIAFSDEETGYLDNVILCYDVGLKAWYTWTHDQTLVDGDTQDIDHILHIFAIDSDEHREGLGVITEKEMRLYPVTGEQNPTVPAFQVLMETGELCPRQPMQAFWYVQQLELRFDYFVGDYANPATVLVEGVDYYGRQFKIEKKLNIKSRGHHGLTGEQRDYVEWIRVDKLVESFRIRIKGKARFRLSHINAKLYQQSDTIGTPYGFDARDTYYNRKGNDHEIHHYIDDYNNLRRAVVS